MEGRKISVKQNCRSAIFLYLGVGSQQIVVQMFNIYFFLKSCVVQSCLTLCNPRDYSTPGFPDFTISQNLLKIMSIESMMPSNHLFLFHPLLLLSWIFPSIRVFSNKLALLTKWSKYQSFSIRPFDDYSGLITFRTDWFDLLAVQGNLKSLLQYYSSKHQFFGTQPSLWSNSPIHSWLLKKP